MKSLPSLVAGVQVVLVASHLARSNLSSLCLGYSDEEGRERLGIGCVAYLVICKAGSVLLGGRVGDWAGCICPRKKKHWRISAGVACIPVHLGSRVCGCGGSEKWGQEVFAGRNLESGKSLEAEACLV